MSTITIYPSGDYSTGLVQYPASGYHYDKLSDSSDSTYIKDNENTSYAYDVFNIPKFVYGTINSVTLYARCDGTTNRTWCKFGFAHIGTSYYGIEHNIDSWEEVSDTWSVSPMTGSAWTLTELCNIQITIGCRLYNSSWTWKCSKFWMVIDYTPYSDSYEVLYPTSEGTYQELSSGTYADVDDTIDVPTDYDYVQNGRETSYKTDTYGMQNLSSDNYLVINRVISLIRVAAISTTGCYATPSFYTNGSLHQGDVVITPRSTSFPYYCHTQSFETNPITGYAWTKSEIQSLEFGVSLKSKSGGWLTNCSQAIIIVFYSVTSGPSARPQLIGLW